MDLQGFDEQADDLINSKLLAIAVLLSSTMLFNVKQDFTYESLKQMRSFNDLPNLIKMTQDNVDENTLLTQIAPKLIVLIRDSHVDLKEATSDKQYLENKLQTFAH